jgi:NAD(P)-dependent dehydrogenase (short-subunit alcohol dehydrogenase family)
MLPRKRSGARWMICDAVNFAHAEAEHDRLDVLLNNAALGIDPVRRVTADGHEATFQVDYLAPYMLSYVLETLLIASAPSRIVNVASAGQAPINFDDIMLERSYDAMQAYCQAKLAEVMLTIDQAAELSGPGVTVNCLHPPFNMPTKIVTHMFTPQSEIGDGFARPFDSSGPGRGERQRPLLRPNPRSPRPSRCLRRAGARPTGGRR